MNSNNILQSPRMATALISVAVALIVLVALATSTGASANGPGDKGKDKVVERVVGADEHRKAKETPIDLIAKSSVPLVVEDHGNGNGLDRKEGPDGPELSIYGVAPSSLAVSSTASFSTLATTATTQNGPWTGSYSTNPNRQIGKLYFWTGSRWSHCTATAVNSENKSLIVTAGHCVYNPDPDNNGRVDGNGSWYTSVQFCPGYESGCKLGVWYARNLYTTNSWFYGSGTSKSYDWSDDLAVVLVSSNPTQGRLVDAVGGHGITFNRPTALMRHAFGYPITDSRWPSYTYSGEDLIYCPGNDTSDGYGHLKLACTMTGGASGGPWIIDPASSWLGLVNSVNSHKAWGGSYMGGPYFGTAESDLFNYARTR